VQSALERWQAIISARAQQMDAAYARLGKSSAGYWDRRARNYHHATKETVTHNPLFLKLRAEVTPQTTLLDVGAGTGRFALALAPQAKQIIAVEPNASMLAYLQQEALTKNISNITCIPTTWQDAPADVQGDIVLCSHVLYPIWDIDTFLLKLRATTRHICYIYMRAIALDALTADLWQYFHGDKRCLPPAYIHALDVMYELGIYANVEVVPAPVSPRYDTLDRAVEEQLEQLILPDTADTRAELRRLLERWLVERDGVLMPPVDELVCAIITFAAQ
jgi:2-polyprenyl-3-methyl-5-hydroxy-6-metoxy-1,4-benzoquinol methylase